MYGVEQKKEVPREGGRLITQSKLQKGQYVNMQDEAIETSKLLVGTSAGSINSSHRTERTISSSNFIVKEVFHYAVCGTRYLHNKRRGSTNELMEHLLDLKHVTQRALGLELPQGCGQHCCLVVLFATCMYYVTRGGAGR